MECLRMKLLGRLIPVLAILLLNAPAAGAQPADYDVFVPIAKYMSMGDVDAISAWYAKNLDIVVLSKGGNSSRNQAKRILKNFFDSYTPRSFKINYTAGTYSSQNNQNQKMTYEEFLKAIAEGTIGCPLAWGLRLAASGEEPMSPRLASYLKDCYEKNMSLTETIEGWI